MSTPEPLPSPSSTAYDQPASSSSSWRQSTALSLSLTAKKSNLEESDDELFTVPDIEAPPPLAAPPMDSANTSKISVEASQPTNGGGAKRRRGRNPADREYRRLKRLLRNRVSAQQARERKKVYVNDLESRVKELQDRNAKLEEKISTLINENTMLRKVLMNTRPKVDENVEAPHDQLSKN